MKQFTLALLMLIGLVAAVSAQDEKPTVIASVAADSKAGIENLRLIETSKNELLAFYCVGPNMFVRCSKDKGATWTDLAGKAGALAMTDKAFGGFDVCIDADDTVTIATATRNTVELMTLSHADAGWVLSEPKKLDAALRVMGPSICKDPAGNLWAAYYHSGHEGLQGIRVSRTPSGERFGENTGKFNIAWGFYSSVQKVTIWRGRPVIVYSGGTPWESVQIYWSAFDGKRWSLPQAGVGECQRTPGAFNVVVDDQDNLFVAWLTFPGQEHVRVRRGDASGKWDAEATEFDLGRRLSAPRLVTDGARTWCLWGHLVEAELRYRVFKNDAWSPEPRTAGVNPLGGSLEAAGRMTSEAKVIPIIFSPLKADPKAPVTEVLFKPLSLDADR